MKENRVTKAQAINLKRLGYDEYGTYFYKNDDSPETEPQTWVIRGKPKTLIPAPTISDAIQWMWDKFGVNIVVWQVDPNEWMYEKYYEDSGSLANGSFPTRPAAQSAGLDAAIQYKLKQIEQC